MYNIIFQNTAGSTNEVRSYTVNDLILSGYKFRGFHGGSNPQIPVPTKLLFSV